MRYLAIVIVAMLVMPAGCKRQPKGPKTLALESPLRPLGSLTPVAAPAPGRAPAAAPSRPPAPVAVEPAPATLRPPAPPSTRMHVVRKGDTLWSIAKRYLGDGKQWPRLVKANPGLDPQKLHVGQTLKVPER